MKHVMVFLMTVAVLFLWRPIRGANPDAISFQGNLNDGSGNPVQDGSYSMTFGIWDSESGGNLLWSETQTVEVTNGGYNVDLGSVNELGVDPFRAVDPWFSPAIEITVEGEVLSPRIPIVSTPYSKIASRLDGDVQTWYNEVLQAGYMTMTASSDQGDNLTYYGPDEIDFLFGSPPDYSEVASFGPGGILFNASPPLEFEVASFDPTDGISFADPATGDLLAEYGPGGAVYVQLQPEPPGPDLASYGPEGIFYNTVGPPAITLAAIDPINGITFADPDDGETAAEYTPDHVSIKGPGGPLDPFDLRIEAGGVVFGVDPSFTPQAEYAGNGLTMFDSQGEVAAQLDEVNGLVLGIDPLFDKYTANGVEMTNTSGEVALQLDEVNGLVMGVEPDFSKYTADGVEMTNTSGEVALQLDEVNGLVMGVDPIFDKYSLDGVEMTNTSGEVALQLDEVNGLVMGVDPLFDKYAPDGIELTNTSGEATVQISDQGSMSLGLNAGSAQSVSIGERYRDNGIVAWGTVSNSGNLISELGVVSATRITTGSYSISLDATAAGTNYLIPMAVAEVESPPTGASNARLLTVNQVSPSSFEVYITDGNYNPVDNDFLFTVTAR